MLPELLAGRALTRHEVVAGLRELGLSLGADPQLPTHLVVHACSTGLVCRGADRGRHATFVLFDEWLPDSPTRPSLPAFDNYLVGYRDRDALLAAELRPQVYSGGMVFPTVVTDGRVAGMLSLRRPEQPARVAVRTFGPLPARVRRAVEAEVADIARFLGRPVRLDSVAEV